MCLFSPEFERFPKESVSPNDGCLLPLTGLSRPPASTPDSRPRICVRPQHISVPGPGNSQLHLSAHDFLANLPSLAAFEAGQPWCASIQDFSARWEIWFRGKNRATVRIFADSRMAADDAVLTITEAAEKAFPSDPRIDPRAGDFRLRVLEDPQRNGFIVLASDVPSVPFISALTGRLFQLELGTHDPLLEQFEFKVPNLELNHQSLARKIDVLVAYSYSKDAVWPDFLHLDEVVKDHFQHYPRQDAYWEEVNRTLVRKLLTDYPMLESLSVTVMVHPDSDIGTSRASTVTMHRSELLLEDAA